MKRILYFMHVNWGWIKQRPHFIAEFLSEEYDVTVFYRKSYRTRSLTPGSSDSKIKLKELFILPFSRFKMITSLNQWLIKKQLSGQFGNCDIVWLTHPDMYGLVMDDLSNDAHVVYDCMDDALEFPGVASSTSIRQQLESQENQLMTRSNTIFATAHYLKDKLLNRYTVKKNIHVINNAINIYPENIDVNLSPELVSALSSTESKKIVYIGTLSEWLDFDLIIQTVEKFSNITYILIGPTEVTIPQHRQIRHFPPVEHKSIHYIMKFADALVMPFMINELILAVNPVKVYEYIYSAKPAIVSKYQETERFSEFVYLYNSEAEYINLIEQVSTGDLLIKTDLEEYISYARRNTWTARVSEISNLLEKYQHSADTCDTGSALPVIGRG